MKKFIAIFVCVTMLVTGMVIFSSAAENELKATVVNDLHLDYVDANAEKVSKRNSISEEYFHASSGGQLPYESVAIIKAFLRDAAESESEIILMPGDLTTIGDKTEHEEFSALISEFELATGKRVFVIPGNHDLFNSSVEEFEEYYADFGYGEAIANDPDTASYVAELNDEYRLLAIDSTTPGESRHGVDSALVKWVSEQCAAAKAEGKKLIAIMHHNLVEHIVYVDILFPSAVVSVDSYDLANALADGGVKFIFTGHTHDHDIAKYTSPNGNTIYDCVTTALNAYPCAYREVSFGAEVKIETKSVTNVDTSLFPDGIHENALALAKENFLQYAKNSTYTGVKLLVASYVSPASLKKLAKIEDEALAAIVDPVIENAGEVINFPLYIKDETEEGKSFEAIAKALGSSLPATEYKTFIDVAVAVYQAHAEGDENYPAYSDEMIIIQRCIAVVLNYSMAELTASEYTMVLSFVAELLEFELSDSIMNAVGGALEKFKGNEMLLTAAILPTLTKFSVDTPPSDNNAVLPGYGEKEAEKTIIQQMIDFFKQVFEFFRTLFAMFS